MSKIINKFRYAFQGLVYGLKNDASIRLQCLLGTAAILVGLVLRFTAQEMGILLAFCGLIIGLEYVNSAIEAIMDLQHPEVSESVRHIKDLAAGGVLAASILALITGLLFCYRHLFL